jgi:hypothetical protein
MVFRDRSEREIVSDFWASPIQSLSWLHLSLLAINQSAQREFPNTALQVFHVILPVP